MNLNIRQCLGAFGMLVMACGCAAAVWLSKAQPSVAEPITTDGVLTGQLKLLPAEAVPESGTFWLVQKNEPPWPFLPPIAREFELPVYRVDKTGTFIVDDRAVDYAALAELDAALRAAELELGLTSQADERPPLPGEGEEGGEGGLFGMKAEDGPKDVNIPQPFIHIAPVPGNGTNTLFVSNLVATNFYSFELFKPGQHNPFGSQWGRWDYAGTVTPGASSNYYYWLQDINCQMEFLRLRSMHNWSPYPSVVLFRPNPNTGVLEEVVNGTTLSGSRTNLFVHVTPWLGLKSIEVYVDQRLVSFSQDGPAGGLIPIDVPAQYFDQTTEHQLTVIVTDYGIPGDPDFCEPATVVAKTVSLNSAISWPEFPEVVAQFGVLPINLVTTNVLASQQVMHYAIQITQLADELSPTNKLVRLLEGDSANNTITESWDYTLANGAPVEPGHLFEVTVTLEVRFVEGIGPTSDGGFTNAAGQFVLCLAPGPRTPEFHCSIHCLDQSGNTTMDRNFRNAANFLKRTVDDAWLYDWIWGYDLYGHFQYENNTGPPMASPVPWQCLINTQAIPSLFLRLQIHSRMTISRCGDMPTKKDLVLITIAVVLSTGIKSLPC